MPSQMLLAAYSSFHFAPVRELASGSRPRISVRRFDWVVVPQQDRRRRQRRGRQRARPRSRCCYSYTRLCTATGTPGLTSGTAQGGKGNGEEEEEDDEEEAPAPKAKPILEFQFDFEKPGGSKEKTDGSKEKASGSKDKSGGSKSPEAVRPCLAKALAAQRGCMPRDTRLATPTPQYQLRAICCSLHIDPPRPPAHTTLSLPRPPGACQ